MIKAGTAKTPMDYYVVDAHCDTLSRAWKLQRDLLALPWPAQSDLGRLSAAGVKMQFWAAFVDPENQSATVKEYLRQIEFFHQQLEKHADLMRLVRSALDIDLAKAAGQVAAVLSIEGGEALAGDLTILQAYYRLGVRSLGLTWNCRNALADGVAERETKGGLTVFGQSVVKEMNRLGMIIDVAHLAEAGFWEVLELSTSSVIASHANCQRVHDHPRNLTDAQLKGLAQKGGVVGITLVKPFLGSGEPDLKKVMEHIEHALSVAGPEHVGIGTDFDGVDEPVVGLEDVSKLPRLIDAMLDLGFTESMIRQIMGENYLRVIRAVLNRGQNGLISPFGPNQAGFII